MKHRWAGALFVAPALALLLLWRIAPILYSAKLALYDVGLTSDEWVGWANFAQLIQPGYFWDSLRVSAKFLGAILFADLVVAYLLALALWKVTPRVATALRACYYTPVILSSLVTVSVWRWFLRYGGGAFNEVLQLLHLPPVMWLGHPAIAPWALCLVVAGGAIGVSVLLYSATLGQLNPELIEQARVDGANEVRVTWDIVTPLMRPTMFYIVVTNTISAFQIWETPYFFTEGGPLRSTSTVALTIFNMAFAKGDYGLASAMTTAIALLTLLLAWLFIRRFGFGYE